MTADSAHGVPGPAGVTDARAHVYVERLDDLLSVGGPDGHHLQRVRRLRPGECFTASDGWGRWRRYAVERTESGVVVGRYGSDVLHDVSPVPRITVACALTKGERPEMVVQKVTELGVDRVLFVATARSVVQWDEYKAVAQLERLHRIAREAGAQSRRARIPSSRVRSHSLSCGRSPAWSSERSTVIPSTEPGFPRRTSGSSRSGPKEGSRPTRPTCSRPPPGSPWAGMSSGPRPRRSPWLRRS